MKGNIKEALKKLCMRAALIALSAVVCLSAAACSLFYDMDDDGKIAIGYSHRYGRAFCCWLYWDGDIQNTDFTVPDEYDGCKMTDLGGYIGRGFPCPFGICAGENCDLDIIGYAPEGDEYEDLVFTVRIGKNLRSAEYVEGDLFLGTIDGEGEERVTDVMYRIVYHFIVDEENPHFASKDGALINKETGETVGGFFYEN